jgi:tRNA dimethylallyltransferase
MRHALIVAGPTCSGKSALALALAERLGGVVINADAMQVYRELRVLTARPTAADVARAPHALYGIRPAAEPGSVAWWREAALDEMAQAGENGRLPILCGGSGMYLAALTGGIAPIPDSGAAARNEARQYLAELGAPGLHARLAEHDPTTAARLHPEDSQRVARAWEVWRGTGRGLAAWQNERAPPLPWRFTALHLDPDRTTLRAAIAHRFAAMLAQDALGEVAALCAQNLDPALPAMRAHGVPELAAHLRGALSLAEATQRAILVTGQYTKRQATWFRHHALTEPGRTQRICSSIPGMQQFSESFMGDLVNFIVNAG